MMRIGYSRVACSTALALALVVGAAGAAPPNSANFMTRVFNDCPASTLVTTDLYPASVVISDNITAQCFGFANLHNWFLSDNGGGSALQFENAIGFRFCADVTLDGSSNGEAGLRVSPWWDPGVEGRLNIRVPDGEIAAFGGRLPFYSFTGTYGVHYVRGTTIHLQVTYLPHRLVAWDPGTIQYDIVIGGTPYSSGPLPFDMGNATQDPPHGLWGILNTAQVGGHLQPFLGQGPAPGGLTATWANICYDNLGTTGTKTSSWGRMKTMYR